MHRVLTAPGAILLDLHAIRHIGLVLGGSVIATLALSAGESNHSAHESNTSNTVPRGHGG